jgi:hypothetical protein
MAYFWGLASRHEMYSPRDFWLSIVNAKSEQVMKDWKEPYYAGRGVGRGSTALGYAVPYTG